MLRRLLTLLGDFPMRTTVQQVPEVIANGTPIEVDKYLASALWQTDGPLQTFMDVVAWRLHLHQRGDDFSSHVVACYYWLCENRALCPAGLFLPAKL